MPEIKKYDSEIKFFPGCFGGEMCDTGGESHNFLLQNNIEPYPIDCKFEGEYKGETLVNMETFMEGSSFILEVELCGMVNTMFSNKKFKS